MDFKGPLPIEPPTSYIEYVKSTEVDLGLAHLTYALRWSGENGTEVDGQGNVIAPSWATAPDGWSRFNASPYAHQLAGDTCAHLLIYVLEAAGSDGLRRALRSLLTTMAEVLE
ncbi:hypothetical protein [Streptomyces sp. NPDC057199]|uniref:hypothetical protein n=1 Tax=Streptomyces sp. NPDC057199 TaxID=3346047 RepID=UPI0036394ABE